MSKPVVPRHAPEVVAAKAAKGGPWSGEKVATTSVKNLDVHGCNLSSRYSKAHEFDRMAIMVENVEPDLRPFLESIYCDSKVEAYYSVMLHPCGLEVAEAIVLQLEAGTAASGGGGGHNGIDVFGHDGANVDRDPYWPADWAAEDG